MNSVQDKDIPVHVYGSIYEVNNKQVDFRKIDIFRINNMREAMLYLEMANHFIPNICEPERKHSYVVRRDKVDRMHRNGFETQRVRKLEAQKEMFFRFVVEINQLVNDLPDTQEIVELKEEVNRMIKSMEANRAST